MIPKRAISLWPLFKDAASRYAVDPYVLLAICDRETLCGQTLAPDGTGDKHHGLGLMQVDARYHPEFAGATLSDGTPAWLDPAHNIEKGAAIFADGLRRLGDEEAAIAAYNAGVARVRRELEELTNPGDSELFAFRRREALDGLTTDHNYLSDVLHRAEMFRQPEHVPSTPPPPPPKE